MRSSAFQSTMWLAAAAALAILAQPLGVAQAAGAPAITQPDAFTWAPAAGLPPGAKMTVLYGDLSKSGPFAVRFQFPAGYEIPTHAHPTDEYITVISGKLRMAFGEKATASGAQAFVPGAFMALPAGSWHHLWWTSTASSSSTPLDRST